MSTDILDSVAAYAPAGSAEWSAARQDIVLAQILGAQAASPDAVEIPLCSPERPTLGRRRAVLAASVAALTAAAGAIVAISMSGASAPSAIAAGSTPFDPPAGLSDAALAPGKYSMQVTENLVLGNDGKPQPGARDVGSSVTYVAADGTVYTPAGNPAADCARGGVDPHGGFETPNEAFFGALPSDIGELRDYLRSHVEGSSSLDEAVFVAVGDALRQTDGLASPKLRADLLAVLSRTPGVFVHEGVRDYLGRPAIRADFVNQAIRPGVVQSLYFDPNDFRVLGWREGANGAPTAFGGPSPAYTAPAPADATDPDELSGAAYVSVVRQEQVVDSLPAGLCG